MKFNLFKNLAFSLLQKSDLRKWRDLNNHSSKWSGRSELMSKYIDDGESVFEFGAGRCHLKAMLPKNCSYISSDIVKREHNTFVCDINHRPLPEFPKSDVAFFSGVLEYVHDLNTFLPAIKKSFKRVIASYADTDTSKNKLSRTSHGWFNHLSRKQFIDIFEENGFILVEESRWERHSIYVFINQEIDILSKK